MYQIRDYKTRLEITLHEKQLIESELSFKKNKDEKSLSGTGAAMTSPCSSGSGFSLSNLHDISVDEKLLESASAIRFRGPSASSTPARVRSGNIGDEIRQIERCADVPSPFCGIEESKGE